MASKSVAGRTRSLVTALLLAICLLGTSLRLYGLDEDSLWYDEIFTAKCSQLQLEAAVACTAADVHPPLMYVVTHFFIVLFGNSEFILRLQAMLFGSLSILLLYKIGAILYSDGAGLVGALLLAVNAYHVQYSQEARHYGLMTFLALLALIFVLKAVQAGREWLWLGFVLSTALSLYNHYFAFLYLPSIVVFALWVMAQDWISCSREDPDTSEFAPYRKLSPASRQALMLLASLVLIGMLYLPWLPTLQARFPKLADPKAVGVSAASLQTSLTFLYEVLTDYTGAKGAPILIWAAVVTLGIAGSKPKHIVMLVLWIGAPFAFLAVVIPTHWLLHQYVLFILPLYLLAAARGITCIASLLGRVIRWPRLIPTGSPSVIVTLTTIFFASLSIIPLGDYYRSEKEDWRSAARYLEGRMTRGDAVLVDAGNCWEDAHYVDFCLSYYLSGHGMANPPVFQVQRQVWQDLQALGNDDGKIWTVLLYPDRPPSWNTLEEINVVDFHDVPVISLRDPSGNMLQNTISMLKALSDLLSSDPGDFDARLALAEIYLQTGRLEEARSELGMAVQVMPDVPEASQDLSEVCAELEHVSHPEDVETQNPLWRSLGQVISLSGFDMCRRSTEDGGTVDLTLWWQAVGKMDKDYTVFIHMVDPEGRIRAQTDRLLQQGRTASCPTSTWTPGRMVTQEYELELAPDIPPGEYIIKIGIYYWQTGERLSVWDGSGQTVADDTIPLDRIVVAE